MEASDWGLSLIVKNIGGKANLLADTLSCLEMEEDSFNLIKWDKPQAQLQYTDYNNHKENTNKCKIKLWKVFSESWCKNDRFEDIM